MGNIIPHFLFVKLFFLYSLGYDFIRDKFKTVTEERVSVQPTKPIEEIKSLRVFESELVKWYHYPPTWQCVIASILFASFSFAIVLFGLRGMTRGIRRFALWIIEGFRD